MQNISYFYSEPLVYCEGMMHREIGWLTMNQLGRLNCVHFEEKILDYQNPFIKNLKRCEENMYKINEIKTFINSYKDNFNLMEARSFSALMNDYEHEAREKKMEDALYMNIIEDEIQGIHKYFIGQKSQLAAQNKQISDKMLTYSLLKSLKNSAQFNQIVHSMDHVGLFDCQCFLANRKDLLLIQKSLFRMSRGNTMLKNQQIDVESITKIFHDAADKLNDKVVCILLYERGEQGILHRKIDRFLSCLEITRLNVPANRWQQTINQFEHEIHEINHVLKLTNDSIERQLHKMYESKGVSGYNYLTYLEAYLKKQKQIYRQLSCFKISQHFIHFHIYIPKNQLPLKVQTNGHPQISLIPKDPPKSPPTKINTSQIMEYPQEILNTYGVPSYGEFNPAVFYIVTFGFFIGVMFGDVGHMLMMIPLLIYFKLNKWCWTLIFFMGYCGLIYNQFFGLNLGLFTSCYSYPEPQSKTDQFVKATRTQDCVYSFGIDSAWKPAQNQMQFVNSLKMKMAVILGVTHMLLGLVVRLINCVKKRKYAELFTVAIPQIIFMLTTFVYMDILIIIKWSTEYIGENTKNAPSIISTMIGIYASFGVTNDPVLWSNERNVQSLLSAISFTMIPIMFLGIPLITFLQRKISHKSNNDHMRQDIPFTEIDDQLHEEKQKNFTEDRLKNFSSISDKKEIQQSDQEKQPLRQIFVHQFIETIQYVLGAVSNTASYLRLWALSLAHGQLSQVIFSLILEGSISGGYGSIPGIFFIFPFFYAVTFGILICMDTMECFLHSLRLHWVEFQNKFYQGKGYLFEPFSFKSILVNQK